jgi:hypothetical protein
MVGHSGAWPGFSATLMVFPDMKCGFAVCANMMAPSAILRLAKMIMKNLLDSLVKPRKTLFVPSASVSWIAGSYALLDAPALKKVETVVNLGPILKAKVGFNISGDPQLIISSWWGDFKSPILTSVFEVLSPQSVIALFDFSAESSLPHRVEFRREGEDTRVTMLFGMDKYDRL